MAKGKGDRRVCKRRPNKSLVASPVSCHVHESLGDRVPIPLMWCAVSHQRVPARSNHGSLNKRSKAISVPLSGVAQI